jgi:peptide/nickel transport system ATP-binding protein
MGTTGGSAVPLLEVKDLSTVFETPGGHLAAVQRVSFSLNSGETLGIAGETGSGKSVLVRSIMDLVPASATVTGDVLLQGRSTRAMSAKERRHLWGPRIAMVFQDPMTSLNPVKKVGVQIVDPLRFHLGLDSRAAKQRARELLDQVRIPEAGRRLSQYPHELSGGMRQRVAIAIALSCHPQLLIADESTTALDVTVQKQILDLLTAIQRDTGMGMVLITHDLAVLATRTDRVMIMYAGRVMEDSPVAELFEAGRHPYTRALLSAIPRLDGVPHARLKTIGGSPPDPRRYLDGCAFAARCQFAQDKCGSAEPALTYSMPATPGGAPHGCRCFFPLGGLAGTVPGQRPVEVN